jgi:8-oxo-dGTP pyrophosphatase MutT (NUDIX family)
VLERRALLERSFITVWEDRVQLPSGTVLDDFCVIDAPDWAGVLCITRDRQVAFVRQYRHGLRGDSLELPAGALEPDELPLDGARRELSEETGFSSERWQLLLSVSVDPARQSGRAHFYAALNAHVSQAPRLDPGEDLETLLVPAAEVMALVDAGRIAHGLHIAALLQAERLGLFR